MRAALTRASSSGLEESRVDVPDRLREVISMLTELRERLPSRRQQLRDPGGIGAAVGLRSDQRNQVLDTAFAAEDVLVRQSEIRHFVCSVQHRRLAASRQERTVRRQGDAEGAEDAAWPGATN